MTFEGVKIRKINISSQKNLEVLIPVIVYVPIIFPPIIPELRLRPSVEGTGAQ